MIRRKFKSVLIIAFMIVIVISTIKTNIDNTCKTNRFVKQNLYSQTVLISKSVIERFDREVDCRRIIEGDELEIAYALEVLRNGDYNCSSNDDVRNNAQNCERFLKMFNYNRFTISKEEIDFPIAFSLLVHKDAVQMEILLRAIYRPHNVYCIHIDRKSNSSLHDAITAITKCLPNVFIASKLEDVIYASYSRLQADINCMQDLLNYTDVKWKYLINLPAQEYPLKTNLEMVKILKLFNGTNSIESVYDTATHYRVNETYKVNPKTLKVESTKQRKPPPPHNMTVGKGSAYGAFSRRFVEFALNDERAQDLLKWTEDTYSPDESFWATLAINKHLGTPGIQYNALGFPDRKLWITTSTTWQSPGPGVNCHGRYVRDICVFGLGDLQKLVSEKEFFANKFYHDYQPYALKCMEEWIFNKSATGNNLPTDLFYYRLALNST
uniref:N-acetyllactosaminide beta-1,6-N-acetylglucosaminyl-transferase-like n=1 Tax=Crassostrea virginica TaxID=6565 RepID=A0A8B8BNE9_CRAVI|nr:N-acetyllactosaminide beta-1,6-N-acetylglucosaminyl-transferase-like [Crassostrea virginica]